MDETLQTFQRFNDREIAEKIADRLRDKGVECIVTEDKKYFDPTFANNQVEPTISLKIAAANFAQAHAALEAYYAQQLQSVDTDYYLLEFTNDELMDIIRKPDEWGHFDYMLAKKLLKERGSEVSPETIDLLRTQRNDELSKPESSGKFWIYIGYLSAILGGFVGVIIAWVLRYHKKTLPDGRRVYSYSAADRRHGKIIMYISIFTITFVTMLKLLNRFEYSIPYFQY